MLMVLNYPVKKEQQCQSLKTALVETVIKRMGGTVKHYHKCFYFKELKLSLHGSFLVLKVNFSMLLL